VPKVKIPRETWHKIWKTLLLEGAVTRVSEDYIYIISERHLHILKEKRLPFEEVDSVATPREKIRHLLASTLPLTFNLQRNPRAFSQMTKIPWNPDLNRRKSSLPSKK